MLVIVAGGLAIWALGAQSDLDDQKSQTAQAQQEAQSANDQLGAMEDQLDDVSQAVDDAGDDLGRPATRRATASTPRSDGIKAKLAALKEQIGQGGAGGGDAEATATP